MTSPEIFDRQQIRRQRDRAAPHLADHDFLIREMAERLADRLPDITRRFPLALELGCHSGQLAEILDGRGGIDTLLQCDLSPALVGQVPGPLRLVADEEALPFALNRFDLVLSVMSLHWVNDLPGCLLQIRHCLKNDGLLLASMLGGASLWELRECLTEAELAEDGGAIPRVSPFADVRDMGALLQRAGFALPVVDSEVITVTYADPFKLLRDLRGSAQGNALLGRRPFRSRRTLFRALELYQERFAGPDGRIPATVQLLTMTAWRPDPSQQQPLTPGSGLTPLGDVLQ